MDVGGLEVFLIVAKNLNYTRAGEEVNLTQPSVSVRIRQLESELEAARIPSFNLNGLERIFDEGLSHLRQCEFGQYFQAEKGSLQRKLRSENSPR